MKPLALICLSALLLASCFSRSSAMTAETFSDVQIGAPISSLSSSIGSPYAIHSKKDGTQEYEYIERINADSTFVAENHYFLVVQDGEVVGKYMTQERPPAYDLIYQPDPNNVSYPNYPSTP